MSNTLKTSSMISSFNIYPTLLSGSPSRAEGSWRVLCCEGPEERRGADGWWCGVHYGGEESPGFSLGKPLPHTPLLHLPDKGSLNSFGQISLNIISSDHVINTEVKLVHRSICSLWWSTWTEETWCFIFRRKVALSSTEPRESHLSHRFDDTQCLRKTHTTCLRYSTLYMSMLLCRDSHTESMSWWKADTRKEERMFTLSLCHSLCLCPIKFFFLLHYILSPDGFELGCRPLAAAH